MSKRADIISIIIVTLICIGCGDKAKSKLQRGKELQAQNEYQDAIAIYESIIRNYPESSWSDSARAARSNCDSILKLIDHLLIKSSAHLRQDKYTKAESILGQVVDIGVNNEVMQRVSELRKEIGETKKASIVKEMNAYIKLYADAINILVVLEDNKGGYVKLPGILTATLIKSKGSNNQVIWRKTKTKEVQLSDYHYDIMYWLYMPHEYLCAEITFPLDYSYTVKQFRAEYRQRVAYDVEVKFKVGAKIFKDKYGNLIEVLRETSGT